MTNVFVSAWVVQIYFLIGVKVNRQVQLTRKVYLSRKYTHYIHFNYNFLILFIDFSKDLKLFYWHLVFPQYILTKIKYILNNVYIIPLTKKQKFDQLFIVKNNWGGGGGGGVTTPQAPPVATPLISSHYNKVTQLCRLHKNFGQTFIVCMQQICNPVSKCANQAVANSCRRQAKRGTS